jgi:hypothetical protein
MERDDRVGNDAGKVTLPRRFVTMGSSAHWHPPAGAPGQLGPLLLRHLRPRLDRTPRRGGGRLLHGMCVRHRNYHIDFDTTVLDANQEDGRVVALKTRHNGVEGRVGGDLFIVCNGRNSHLRKACGLETGQFETTADALWLRFDLSSGRGVHRRAALPHTSRGWSLLSGHREVATGSGPRNRAHPVAHGVRGLQTRVRQKGCSCGRYEESWWLEVHGTGAVAVPRMWHRGGR